MQVSVKSALTSTSDRHKDGYQYDDGYGTSKAPDEFVINGDPTEVWVPITLWVQAHCQACSKETDSQIRQEHLLKDPLCGQSQRQSETGSTACDRVFNNLNDGSRKRQRRSEKKHNISQSMPRINPLNH